MKPQPKQPIAFPKPGYDSPMTAFAQSGFAGSTKPVQAKKKKGGKKY